MGYMKIKTVTLLLVQNYDRNNFFVKYQTADNKIYTGYFDWVAVTEKKMYGNTLKDEKGNILYEYTPYWETDPSKVAQIMVIEKAPIYSDPNGQKKFYYYEDTGWKYSCIFFRERHLGL